MSKFKKLYTQTFDNIHTPQSIKEEVLSMAKNLNDENTQNNDTIETNVERSSFHPNKFVAIAVSIAVVSCGMLGFHMLTKDNQSLVSNSNSDTSDSNLIDTSLVSYNQNVTDNSNFADIFGINIEDCNGNYAISTNSTGYTGAMSYIDKDSVSNVLNSFDTSNWSRADDNKIYLDDNANDDILEMSTVLNIQLEDDKSLIVNFFKINPDKNVEGSYFENDCIYVIVNSIDSVMSTYKIDYDVYNNIINTVNSNNYMTSNKNISLMNYKRGTNDNRIYEDYDFDTQQKDSISNIQNALATSMKNWEVTDLNTIFSDANYLYDESISLIIDNDDLGISLSIYKYNDITYASMSLEMLQEGNSMSGSNIQQQYLINDDIYNQIRDIAINSDPKNVTITTINDNSTLETTISTTTTKPKETTTSVTTTTTTQGTTTTKPTTTTTMTSTSKEDVQYTTSKVYSLATPDLQYCVNMNNSDTLPQFLDSYLQQLFCDAYAIEQGFAFGCPFQYDESDNITVGNKSYSRISSSEIQTLDDVRCYFKQYFTDNYINTSNMMSNFIEQDGKVYGVNGARGGNMDYIGHSFVLDDQRDDRIIFHANAYYITDYDDPDSINVFESGQTFYNQEPTIPYETNICNYVLINTEDGLRFDDFDVML